MIKSNFKLILIFLFIPFFCFSQKKDIKLIINSKPLMDCNYELFNPKVKITMIYKDTLDVKNVTTEELMTSIFSATNQKWVDYNSLGGKEKATPFTNSEFLEKIKYKDKNYMEMLSKLEFKSDSIQYAIVKFNYYLEQHKKNIKGSILMQKEKNRWYQTSNAKINNLTMMMLVFKEDILGRLLTGQGINKMEKDLISIIYNDGLDIDKLFQQNFTTEQKDYFINKLNW